MSTDLISDDFPAFPELDPEEMLQTFTAPPLPEAQPEEADTFERQSRVPGHDQSALDCRAVLVGAGGLNSWIGMGLVRSGVTSLTVIDPDLVERSNLPRQFYFGQDLGQPKGSRLAHNLSQQALVPSQFTGIAMHFEDAIEAYPLPCDLLVVGVDNNPARLAAARFARRLHVPAVFVGLTLDGMQMNAFLQGRWSMDACWHCAQPNLDPDSGAPCAAATITSCLLAASVAVFLAHRALMGWPGGKVRYNWREADLLGVQPDRTGFVHKRPDCPTCGQL